MSQFNCPVCNAKMLKKGILGNGNGLTGFSPEELLRTPFYECYSCKINENAFGYQRTFLKGIWYAYYHAKWNFLRAEVFNPSRR